MKPIPLNNPKRQARHKRLIIVLLMFTACMIILSIVTQKPWTLLLLPTCFILRALDP